MWSADSARVYFMSDQGGAENLWEKSLKGGAPKQVTQFRDGRVLWPSISYDGKAIVFERDFSIWKLDTATGKAAKIEIARRGATGTPEVSHLTLTTQFRDLVLAPDLPIMKGDSARLRQVIHNLLQNAQDALAGLPQPAIMIQTETLSSGIRFTISDNGGGFPEQVRARVFEPYVTTKPKGTGLGLPIVKKIIEEHRGTIQIENMRPYGARISIILPVSPDKLVVSLKDRWLRPIAGKPALSLSCEMQSKE